MTDNLTDQNPKIEVNMPPAALDAPEKAKEGVLQKLTKIHFSKTKVLSLLIWSLTLTVAILGIFLLSQKTKKEENNKTAETEIVVGTTPTPEVISQEEIDIKNLEADLENEQKEAGRPQIDLKILTE